MKSELRKNYIELRKNLSFNERENLSIQIFNNLIQNFDLKNKNVSVFLPIERFNEINTWHIIHHFTDTKFILPVVKNDELVHILFEDKNQLKKNDWGILEPVYGNQIQEEEIDIVLVPLLTFDEKGYRVGYGKGYYDKFLAKCNSKCVFIGLSFFEVEKQSIEINEYDIPLHFCVTPENVYEF